MADIVQLVENGVKKYLKTHAKAIDGATDVFVSKTGVETIKGTKTFSDGLVVGGVKDTKKVEKTVQMGYGTTARFIRSGNIVTFSQSIVAQNGRPDGKSQMTEKIPEGFKPTMDIGVNVTTIVGPTIQKDRYFCYLFSKDGNITSYQLNINTQPIQFLASASWITSDEFPS